MDDDPFVACDRCRARSSVAYRRGESVWSFCRHHAREHDKALRGIGYTRQTIGAMVHSG